MNPLPPPRPLWHHTPVLDLLGRLAVTPRRPDGILDIPFEEYVVDVTTPWVATLLESYSRPHKRPTLRAVLGDPRFRRWVEVSGRSPMRKFLEKELAIVCNIVEEEHVLDDEPEEPSAPPAAPTLRAWAEEVGVSARLRDPATALTGLVARGRLWSVLHGASRATVGDMLDGNLDTFFGGGFSLPPSDRKTLSGLAEAYVREAGERVVAERREDARIAALAHVPVGDGVRTFLTALDVAIASTAKRRVQGAIFTDVALEDHPLRLQVNVPLLPDRNGRARVVAASLLLEDWRAAPLATKLHGGTKEARKADVGRLVLLAARRVLGDPRHAVHAPLLAYLNEPPWTRVLANLDVLAARLAKDRVTVRVEWRVDSAVRIVPLLGDGQAEGSEARRATSAEAIVHGNVGSVSARDEAVARALWVEIPAYYYGASLQTETRGRAFRALSLLAGHDGVRGRGGVHLRVREGSLGIALEQEGEDFRFVFDV
ncbi:MAG TPA: hypothetical protein VF316_21900, partial [Polyangiaceae bacterium]